MKKSGGGISFGLGAFADFKELAETLEGKVVEKIKEQSPEDRAGNLLRSVTISSIDAGEFEKKIDEFAFLVGEKDFYMKVGGVLRTESAFLGHVTHDQAHEHIEAKERQDVQVEEIYRSRDNSFSLSFGDLQAVFSAIKNQIFEEAIAEGAPREEAQRVAEDEVEKIERDVTAFKKKAKKVRELVEKARKREAKGKCTEEENTISSADDIAIDWMLNPPSDEASTSGAHMSELFREVIWEKSNLTPREEMLAYVPKNETEKALKETTLLRYEAEVLIAKHPDAADLFGKIFVGAMYGQRGAEYAGAAISGGPIGVAVKYASQEAISFAMDTTIEESSSKAVEGMAVSPSLREEFKTTLKVSAYTTLCAGSIKASKKLVGTLSKSAASRASASKNVDNIISEAERKGFRGVRGQIELHTPKGFGRNKDVIINGRNYWGHVLDRMQDRGIPFSVVEDCIKHGKIVPSTKQVSRLEHYDAENNIKVITDRSTGDVISIIFGGKK